MPNRRRNTPAHMSASIGFRIRETAAKRGVEIPALAEAIGLSPTWISQVAGGTVALNVEHLTRISLALDCSIASLLPTQAAARRMYKIPIARSKAADEELLAGFRRLNPEDRAAIRDLLLRTDRITADRSRPP